VLSVARYAALRRGHGSITTPGKVSLRRPTEATAIQKTFDRKNESITSSPVPSEIPCDLGDLLARCFQGIVGGEVNWLLAAPNQVARAADQNDGPWIKKSVAVAEVMHIGTGIPADMAAALVMLPNRSPKEFPLVRIKKVVVCHGIIYAVCCRFRSAIWGGTGRRPLALDNRARWP